MGIEYNLLTCLGKGVPFTASTNDTLSRTAHGMRAGHPVRFTSTGTLPAPLAVDTTYYVSATDLAVNTFKVSATLGGGVVDITSTGSGTHTVVGEYWATLPATDPGGGGNYRARYGTAGSELVWARLQDWGDWITITRAKDLDMDIVVEVQGKFNDTSYIYYAIQQFRSITVHSKIMGVRSDAFHAGVIGAGYVNTFNSSYRTHLPIVQPNGMVDGLEFRNNDTTVNLLSPVQLRDRGTIQNCILQGNTGVVSRSGGGSINVFNNIFYKCAGYGFAQEGTGATENNRVAYNIAYGCRVGFIANLAPTSSSNTAQSEYYGNISVASTVANWGKFRKDAIAVARYRARFNIGDASDIIPVTFNTGTNQVNYTAHGFQKNELIRFVDNGDTIPIPGHVAGETVYYTRTISTDAFTLTATVNGATDVAMSGTDSGTHQICLVYDLVAGPQHTYGIASSADFVDFTDGATLDLRPSGPTATQVDFVGEFGWRVDFDIADDIRPNYQPSLYPDEQTDAGPFEYDHGNGLAPTSPLTIAASSSLAGAEVRIYDLDNNPAGSLGTELAGVEECLGETFSYPAAAAGNLIWIQIMKNGYEEYGASTTVPTYPSTYTALLKTDINV